MAQILLYTSNTLHNILDEDFPQIQLKLLMNLSSNTTEQSTLTSHWIR